MKFGDEKDHASVSRFEDVEDDVQLSEAEERRLIRRLDFRLIGAAGIGYSISLMDRTNVGMAAITGMLVDLKLVPSLYVRCPFYDVGLVADGAKVTHCSRVLHSICPLPTAGYGAYPQDRPSEVSLHAGARLGYLDDCTSHNARSRTSLTPLGLGFRQALAGSSRHSHSSGRLCSRLLSSMRVPPFLLVYSLYVRDFPIFRS